MLNYTDLDKRGQIARIRKALLAALAPQKAISCRSISHRHNTSFRLETSDGLMFARVSRESDRSVEAIADEMAWIAELFADGMPVAKPIQWDDGKFVRPLAGELGCQRFATLFEWRPGKARTRPNSEQWEAMGRAMAMLHEQSANRADLGVHRWEVDGMFGNKPDLEENLREAEQALGPEARALLESVNERYLALRPSLGAPQLIHGDLHQWNVLFDGNDEMTLLDFDDSGRAPVHYDFVVPLTEMEDCGQTTMAPALYRGYEAVRPLPDGLNEAMPTLRDLRASQLVLWIVGERHNPTFASWWEEECRELLSRISQVS